MSKLKTAAVEVVAPLLAFIGVYIAGMLAIGSLLSPLFGDQKSILFAWASLASAAIANLVCVALFDRFRLHLGLFEAPAAVAGGFAKGALVAIGLLSAANVLIVSTTGFRHETGPGADWGYVLALFVPAAIHEELVFRGYLFQKPARLNLPAAVVLTSLLFAFVHGGNPSVGWVALANIFLAGLLLALSWVWRRNLWIPIGMHVVWNIFTGPILGHEVSGMVLPATVLRAIDPGPALLTGGDFGIEASVYLTLAELGAIAFVVWRIRATGALSRPSSIPAIAPAIELPAEGSASGTEELRRVDDDRVNEREN